MHAEIVDDRVERLVGIRQRLGIAVIEGELRVRSARFGQHCRREIEPRHDGTALDCGSADHTGAATQVQHPHAAPHAAGIEQDLNKGCGCPRESRIIGLRHSLPAGMLECANRFGIEIHPACPRPSHCRR
jgi:hypothetical protein